MWVWVWVWVVGCGVWGVGYGVWVVATMNRSLLAYCGVPDDPTQTCVITRPPHVDTASATTIIATSTDMSRQPVLTKSAVAIPNLLQRGAPGAVAAKEWARFTTWTWP
eukprot:COSAG02_NODE_11863_length_1640_cov_15.564568_2_plen_108_part_00